MFSCEEKDILQEVLEWHTCKITVDNIETLNRILEESGECFENILLFTRSGIEQCYNASLKVGSCLRKDSDELLMRVLDREMGR